MGWNWMGSSNPETFHRIVQNEGSTNKNDRIWTGIDHSRSHSAEIREHIRESGKTHAYIFYSWMQNSIRVSAFRKLFACIIMMAWMAWRQLIVVVCKWTKIRESIFILDLSLSLYTNGHWFGPYSVHRSIEWIKLYYCRLDKGRRRSESWVAISQSWIKSVESVE